MLTKLRSNRIISRIAEFFDKKYFPFIVGVVIALFHITGQNEVGYIFVAVMLAFINLCCADIRPAVPVVFMAILVTSTRGTGYMQSALEFFTRTSVIAVIAVALALIVVTALLRLYYDKTVLNCFRGRKLLYGFVALSVAMLLGGLGSEYFAEDSLGLAFTLILAGLVLYLFFSGTLHRREDDLEYVAYCCMATACVVIAELIALYARVYHVGMPLDGDFKSLLVIGWGISNPIGELLAFMLAPVFLLVYKRKHGWLYYLFAVAQMIAVYFTLSRNALLFGVAVFVSLTAVCIIGSKNRIGVSVVAGVVIVGLALLFGLGHDTDAIKNVFAFIAKMGASDNGRFVLWRRFWEFFLEYPIFGASFTACGTLGQASIRMAHNTILQLLGSCGIVGIIANGYHRVQTVLIFTKRPNMSRTIMGVALLCYILMGLLDPIYMFANFTIYYSIILVFAENDLNHSEGISKVANAMTDNAVVTTTDGTSDTTTENVTAACENENTSGNGINAEVTASD